MYQSVDFFPFRDRQAAVPVGFCPGCGGPLYPGEDRDRAGRCPGCVRRNQQKEEDAMTLQEMGAAYRDQARVLQTRIRDLEAARAQEEEREERMKLTGRIDLLRGIWRETRDLSVLLERYYDRGYRRSGKYTL